MSKLLIVGASVLQLPAIKKAKALGHYVAVADYNSQAVGIPFADKYYNASTIDADAITEVAKQFQPDGIMTLATDMPMRSIAQATYCLGLPGITMETAVKSTDKGEMIEAFKAYKVPSPWYFVVSDFKELQELSSQISYPCIVKPTDNSGSRGVILVNSADELAEAFQYSSTQSRGGKIIVEEYLQGKEVSVEIMVVDGDVHVLAVTDKLTTGAPFFVEMGHSQQSSLSVGDIVRIKEVAKLAVKAVGLNSGPAHVEIMLTKQGPKMIELGARMGGDCITTHLVPLSTGIDMIKATIDVSLGLTPNLVPQFEQGSAIRYINVTPGTITSIEGIDESRSTSGVQEVILQKKLGDQVSEIHSSLDRVGFIIAQGRDAKEAVCICEEAMENITIKTE
ncbi:ATP-grasp domain-containing protein [uncultured Bacteroides sp.]|uniref:ATP-grasp domain-containing protein n=1 Tax=uncultured Bacteroides sp. TaxID=162156 RepID=UPI00260B1F72|nr:ATP-grasp domain-containing protein [uncultured Bacteroides sp.]